MSSHLKRLLKPLYWVFTFQLRQRMRERRIVLRLRASGLVDTTYYRSSYPETNRRGIDPVVHYVRHGAAEGRNPNNHFDTAFYLANNPDIVLPHSNPLDHFHSCGWREGRNPDRNFDVNYYLASNPDVLEFGSNPLVHYLHFGRAEGRRTGPLSPQAELQAALAAASATISIREIVREAPTDVGESNSLPIVLCAAHVVPFPPRAGNHLRIYRYLRWLEQNGYQVVMISSPTPGEELNEDQLQEAASGITNLIYCDRRGELRVALSAHLWPLIDGLEGQKALPLPDAATAAPSDELGRIEATFCPDVAVRTALHIDAQLKGPAAFISHYVFSTRMLAHARPETLKIIDTIDVFSTKLEKVAAYGVDGEIILAREEERCLLLRGDVMMAIQSGEARELKALVPEREVINAGIDFSPDEFFAPPERKQPTILLIASSNALNVKGLRDFMRYAWPFVRRSHPGATLLVGGAISSSVPPESPGVRVLGFVDSLDELYQSCHVVINPAVAGTGLKIKTVEALAAHRRIVTWPLGVDGLPPELARLCSVASDWYHFHLLLCEILSQPSRQQLGMEDRERIALELSGMKIYKQLIDVLDRNQRSGKRPPALAAQSGLDHREGGEMEDERLSL